MKSTIVYNADCMDGMKDTPDKYYDLAIVDPPYGNAGLPIDRRGGTWAAKYGKVIQQWDIAPGEDYFRELFRVSKNQIVWGGNYFSLPGTRCFIVWNKNIPDQFTMAMCEYAWTSFNENAKIVQMNPARGNRIHPTQKPVELYEWLLNRYAHEGDKILDTHVGSGSSRIAAYNLGYEYVGYEISKEYFMKQEERFEKHTAQQRLF